MDENKNVESLEDVRVTPTSNVGSVPNTVATPVSVPVNNAVNSTVNNAVPTTTATTVPAIPDMPVINPAAPVVPVVDNTSPSTAPVENINIGVPTSAGEVKHEDVPRKTFEQVQAEREAARREKEKYQAPPVSKFRYALTVILFIVMFGLVIFLPKISDYIALRRAQGEEEKLGPIVTGTLKCTSKRTSEKYNINYTDEFEFKDSKLFRLTHVVSTEGDEIIDADDLNTKLSKCRQLETMTKGLTGVSIVCSLSNGTLVETQIMNYALLDADKVTTAFVEAGGLYPEYVNNQNIDQIEKNMNAANYKCERLR